jgi:hypothetical protein
MIWYCLHVCYITKRSAFRRIMDLIKLNLMDLIKLNLIVIFLIKQFYANINLKKIIIILHTS